MKSIKIWNNGIKSKDTYLDFKGAFSCNMQEKVFLRISCDNVFTVYVNNETVGFGACCNFIKDKEFYTFDLTKFVKEQNVLKITVWHQGEDTQTYISQNAYLMFEITQGKEVLLASNKDILCRVNNGYKQNYQKWLTPQLGFSYYYDFTTKELPYEHAIEYGEDKANKKQNKNLKLLKRCKTKIKETQTGYLIDLGKETVGFLEFEIESEKEQEILISYGEHLVNGKVPRIIGNRDFSFEFKLKKGENKYINTFRRIAGRYLEVNTKSIKINYLGIRVVEYPLVKVKKKFEDKLLQKIYDTSVYTLKCCMHEHYVNAYSYADKLFGTKTDLEKTKKAIKDTFYDKETGLYNLSTNCKKPSILGNSLAILIGLGDKELAEKLKSGKGLIPITLSMNTFFYDALLKLDKNNKEWIIENIKEKYSYMLSKKATTFWETEKGYKDFDNAGSLCHGWSAMPVYYFKIIE